jgi:acyl-CoA reductase-like NAD-dependent aldehyde dehydrogenase
VAGRLRTITPIDGTLYVERPLSDRREIAARVERARAAQRDWRRAPLAERVDLLHAAVAAFVARRDEIALEITWQMGRPLRDAPGEVRGFEERAHYMLAIAPEALATLQLAEKPGFSRFVRREAVGVVLTIAPWNYPYLTAVNSVVPALAAGNAVILRHSAQTPLCAERFAEAFEAGGLPAGVFQFLHAEHEDVEWLVRELPVDHVAFTGSVDAGRTLQRAAAALRFPGLGLELGGKDPAYVRPDADLGHAVAGLVDGAFFNAGQSCCGIERIYVHEAVYARFVEAFVETTRTYRLGDPRDPGTTLGPMVRAGAAELVRAQVAEAVAAGARSLVDPAGYPADSPGTPYLAPRVLVDVDHSMRIMTEETFGPAVGIQRVRSDGEAVALMNDSAYGLTASIWTADADAALAIGDQVETGTWFQNRCDYLDPALAWTGVKSSGRGCTLSRIGYEALTRPKSFHLRTETL